MELVEEKYVIGVDLGGTWVRAALSDMKGNMILKVREQVDKSSADALSGQIINLARSLCKRKEIGTKSLEGVGIASAGPLSLKGGALVKPTNLPFKYVPLTKPVSEELKVPVYLLNDCTAAVLGEKVFGAGKNVDNLVYVTISTGIGGGAIVDGHLLIGKDGNAHEIGHFTIDLEGRLVCGCGKKGHWEAYCSGRNIPNYVKMRCKEINESIIKESLLYKKLKENLSSKDLYDNARMGDKLSQQLIEEIGKLNAIGFANVINAYDPELITVGGSVTLNNKKLVLTPIRRHVKEYSINRLPKIVATQLGEDIGLYGAIAGVLKFNQT